jgi:hypothetical protein
MSRFVFEQHTGRLWLYGTVTLGPYAAANFVDSASDGPWPAGIYTFAGHRDHPDDSADSAFGRHGIFLFTVPNRTGMGVHSGRASVPDGLGRTGPFHATMGCIRTTDDAMGQLITLHQTDPVQRIDVLTWRGITYGAST